MKQNNILAFLLIIAIIIVLCNEILFTQTPELIPKGHEIGNILSNLSLAYISSFIFYVIVVKYKEKIDKKNIYPSIYRLGKQLVGRGNSVITTLATADGFNKTDIVKNITREEYLELCKRVNPKQFSANTLIGSMINHREATFSQLIYNNSYSNVKALLEKIFIYMPFLESDFLKLLNQINESTFFLMADVLATPEKFQNTDFAHIAEQMFDYHLLLRKTDAYLENHYKKYIR